MPQGGSSASVGGGRAATTGLVCSRVEVAAVVAGSGTGVEVAPVVEVATVVARGRRGCDGEGGLRPHEGRWRDGVALVLQRFEMEGEKKKRENSS